MQFRTINPSSFANVTTFVGALKSIENRAGHDAIRTMQSTRCNPHDVVRTMQSTRYNPHDAYDAIRAMQSQSQSTHLHDGCNGHDGYDGYDGYGNHDNHKGHKGHDATEAMMATGSLRPPGHDGHERHNGHDGYKGHKGHKEQDCHDGHDDNNGHNGHGSIKKLLATQDLRGWRTYVSELEGYVPMSQSSKAHRSARVHLSGQRTYIPVAHSYFTATIPYCSNNQVLNLLHA